MQAQRFAAASSEFEDGLARICRLYGITPLAGRLYGQLFLAEAPMPLELLAQRVGAAKSSTSVALRKLLGARVVRRLPRRGDRRDYYEAVTDPWVMLADWARLYLEPELAMWQGATATLTAALAADDAPDGPHADVVRRRLERMVAFAAALDQLMRQLRPPEEQ